MCVGEGREGREGCAMHSIIMYQLLEHWYPFWFPAFLLPQQNKTRRNTLTCGLSTNTKGAGRMVHNKTICCDEENQEEKGG